jgi:hypothetical protein
MGVVLVVAAAALLSACTPKKLLGATVSYAQLSDAAVGELSTVPGMVSEICVLRAQLEYMTIRVAGGAAPTTFAEFFATTESKIDLPGAPTITWKQHCGGYRLADEAFEAGLSSIAAYGGALRAFATEDEAALQHLVVISASVGTGTAALSTKAAPYRDAIAQLGTPVGQIADVVKQRWKAKKLGGLIDKVDPALQLATKTLVEFVTVVKTRQVRDLREALDILSDELEEIRETTSPKGKTYKIDLVTAMTIDIEMSGRIVQMERRLDALVELLPQLATAHAELRKGWNAGEDLGTDTIKAIAGLSQTVYANIRAFQTAARGPE